MTDKSNLAESDMASWLNIVDLIVGIVRDTELKHKEKRRRRLARRRKNWALS